MLSINEGCYTSPLLSLSNHVQSDGSLTGRFRSIYLDDSSPRQTAYSQSQIDRENTGGDNLDIHPGLGVAQPHDGTFTEILFNPLQSKLQCLLPSLGQRLLLPLDIFSGICCHLLYLPSRVFSRKFYLVAIITYREYQ